MNLGLKLLLAILLVLSILIGVVLLRLRRMVRKFQRATNTYEDWSGNDGQEIKNLHYGDSSSNRYDLYLPAHDLSTRPQGVILYIHGGGWSGGSRGDMAFACKRYTKAGYVTATMEYTLLKKGDDPLAGVTRMLDEITACIGAIQSELTSRGIHANKIALGGASAGGHLAMLYAYARGESSPLPIAFIVSQCGPTSLKYWVPTDIPEGAALVAQLSPIHYVDRGSVPTLFSHGVKDSIVPYSAATDLAEKLKVCGVPHVFVPFPNSNHAHEGDPDRHAEFHERMLEFCMTYFGYREEAQL